MRRLKARLALIALLVPISAALGGGPAQAATPVPGTFYVTERFDAGVAKVTVDPTGTATVQNDWATGLAPRGPDSLVFDHHNHLAVSNSDAGSISLLDAATGAIVTLAVNATGIPAVADLAMDPNSDNVFAIGWDVSVIARVSLTNGTTTPFNPSGIQRLGGVAVTPDGSRLFVSSHNGVVYELDFATGALLRSLNVGGFADGMTIDPTTGHLFVSTCSGGMCEIDIGTTATPTLSVVKTYNISGDGIAADGKGHIFVVHDFCCLSRVDLSSGEITAVASGIKTADDVAPLAGAGAPPPATPMLTGRAYGAAASVVTPLQTATLAPTPDTGYVTSTAASSTSTPCTVSTGGVVTAGVLCANVTTALGPARSTATASVVKATINTGIPGVPIITATGVKSTSQTTCAGSTGTTTIDSLTIDGVAQNTVVGPNSVISISGPVGAKLILNEQVPIPGGLTVNAIHLIVPTTGGVSADVVIASATSDIHNCP
jgi:hypothetical protein